MNIFNQQEHLWLNRKGNKPINLIHQYWFMIIRDKKKSFFQVTTYKSGFFKEYPISRTNTFEEKHRADNDNIPVFPCIVGNGAMRVI